MDMNVPDGLLSVGGKTGVQAIHAFILLDLIGASNPSFHDQFSDSTVLFQRIVKIGGHCLSVLITGVGVSWNLFLIVFPM